MTSVGLKKMLRLIKDDPANIRMVDRYVSLVRELPNDVDKIDPILDLARTQLESEPREAMRFAYMVYRYDRTQSEAARIMAQALRQVGANDKAAQLEKEIARERALQQTVKIPSSPLGTDEDVPLEKDAAQFAKTMQLPPAAALSGSVFKTHIHLDIKTETEQDTAPNVLSELFRFYVSLNLYDEAEAFLNEQAKHHQQESWWVRCSNELKKRPKFQKSHVAVIQLQQRAHALIGLNKYRQALNLIRKQTPDLASAQELESLYLILRSIWPKLGLRGFRWKVEDGAQAFLKRLGQPEVQRLSSILHLRKAKKRGSKKAV